MTTKVREIIAGGILAVASAFTHLIFFGRPLSVIFDEIYFLKFIGYYWEGMYYFDVHPPLGKLIFFWFGQIFGITPSIDIGSIGTSLDPALILFRIVPLTAGILIPLVIYRLCRTLELSRLSSLSAGLLLCIENSLIVQSRLVVMDLLLVLFGFLSFLFYLNYRKRVASKRRGGFLLLASALAFAATISIKWNGLFFIIPIAAFELYDLYHLRHAFGRAFLRLITHSLLYATVALVLYVSSFAIHFALLPKTGPGDAFMSPQFLKTLEGTEQSLDPSIMPRGFFGKFFELNEEMFNAHNRMKEYHTYASKFYTWPAMQRPIYYWHQAASSTPTGSASAESSDLHSRIYLLGNPFIYWLGGAAIVALFVLLIGSAVMRKTSEINNRSALAFILIGFAAQWLPYIFIGRVMFLYHYTSALVMSVIAIAYLFDIIPRPRARLTLIALFFALSLVSFVFFSPLTYGTPLPEEKYEMRVWFTSWK
jgi:dolichyl-phosphate-mannose-protein mannosyltransferase